MSVEEDTDLRNLVAQALENKGVLPKIRAELRANVFLALEENANTRDTILKNEELSAFIQIPVGILILNLIREFLEFFNLDFTLSVFDPETKYGKDYNGITRERMIKELNIPESKKKGPLLYEIISNIVSDFKDESKTNFKSDRNIVTLNLNHCDVSLNGGTEVASPTSALNSTYVKSRDNDSPKSPGIAHSNGDDEQNDSIEEELTSNKSSLSENLSNDINIKMDQADSPADVSNENVNDAGSFKPIPENSTEFDLLKFTPVKEVKAKEHIVPEETDKKEVKEKGKVSSMSVLGDLPPLNGKTEEKKNKMNEIKAIIDQGLNLDNYDDDFHSSVSSKSSNGKDEGDNDKYLAQSSDRSHNLENASEKSEKVESVEEENFLEEELSDLINNHNSPENQLTVDETVSRLSDVADHLESL